MIKKKIHTHANACTAKAQTTILITDVSPGSAVVATDAEQKPMNFVPTKGTSYYLTHLHRLNSIAYNTNRTGTMLRLPLLLLLCLDDQFDFSF